MQIEQNSVSISSCHLVTVDVWDTLLRRRCHPDAIKLHLSRYLLNNYWKFLPAQYRDHWKLMHARLHAEEMLATHSKSCGYDDEYLYHEVYKRWLELVQFDFDGTPDGFPEELSGTLERVELDQEFYVTYPDPHIRETLAKYAACQLVFLSDFYFPAYHVQKLLDAHGLSGLVPSGVVSCDVKLNKKSGRLFQHFHEVHGIVAEEHIHIGDNEWSDVGSPRRLGIEAVHYIPDALHKKRTKLEDGFRDRPAFLRNSVHKLLEAPPPPPSTAPEDSVSRFFYDMGRRQSLLLFTFVLHVMERSVADGVDKLFFFTREGEFFLKLFNRIKGHDVLGHPVADAALLEVSRVATFAGSLREFSCAELMRIWNLYSSQSLAALFLSLDIAPTPFLRQFQAYGLELHEPIICPWLDQRVQALFADAEFGHAIGQQIEEKKRTLLSYLSSKGLTGRDPVAGIVDIGWRGTIQDNLAYLLPVTRFHGYYLSLNRFLNVQPANCVKNAFGPDLNKESTSFDNLLDYVAPMEMLCNSPNGSVQAYNQTESGVQATKLLDPTENMVHENYVCHFQQGVLDSMAYWADFSRTHAFTAEELRPAALQQWADLIHKPDPNFAKIFFELNHNEVFGMGTFEDKSYLPDLATVFKAFIHAGYEEQLQRFMLGVGWLPGLLVNPEMSSILRFALRLFMVVSSLKASCRRKMQKVFSTQIRHNLG